MNVYYLSDEVINGYLLDLIDRLRDMTNPPDFLCAITTSGQDLLRCLMKMAKEIEINPILQCQIGVLGKVGNELKPCGFSIKEIQGRRCLLLDSTVHSGTLMNQAHGLLSEAGAAEVASYALVLKRGSRHIPTFWGLMIADVDRALFGLRKIPNHRLSSGGTHEQSALTISLLDERHLRRPKVTSGLPSMDRATWSDRHFDMKASGHGSRTYVLEYGAESIGYLTLHFSSGGRCLHIDEVALSESWQGNKVGGVLLRFAFTLARHHDSSKVRLFAVTERTGFYEKHGFAFVLGKPVLNLDTERYALMEKTIMHEPDNGSDGDA